MDKRILLLTDFSKNALNAARYALDLYSGRKSTFYLLNTYLPDRYSIDSHAYTYSGQRSVQTEKPKTEEKFEHLIQVLGLQNKNANHSYHTLANI